MTYTLRATQLERSIDRARPTAAWALAFYSLGVLPVKIAPFAADRRLEVPPVPLKLHEIAFADLVGEVEELASEIEMSEDPLLLNEWIKDGDSEIDDPSTVWGWLASRSEGHFTDQLPRAIAFAETNRALILELATHLVQVREIDSLQLLEFMDGRKTSIGADELTAAEGQVEPLIEDLKDLDLRARELHGR